MLLLRAQFEFTRPSNTTAYASGEVVSDNSNIITFVFRNADGTTPPAGGTPYNGGQYMIKRAKLCSNSSGTTNASFDLYFYTSGVTGNVTDNSPFNQGYGNKHIRIGKTSFTLTNPDANSDSKEDINIDVNLPFKGLGATIYGVLVTTAAYTPTSGEKFYGDIEILVINA